MIIKRIEIGGFGKWKNKVIDLDSHFQVFFGNNEAGKSTIYQFIRYVLFDQSSRKSEQNDYTPKDHSLHGGRIIILHPVHGELKIERFKTHHKGQGRVYFPDGQVGDQKVLKEVLSPLTLSLFDEVFSLQQEELLRIKNLDEDTLQQLLLTVGVSGSNKILKEQKNFEKKHKELYRPAGRVRPLNQQLEIYRELEEQISKKEHLERDYREQVKELGILQQTKKEEILALEKIQTELKLVSEQDRLWPEYEEYQKLAIVLENEQGNMLTAEQIKELKDLEKEEQFIQEQITEYQKLKESQLVSGQLSPALVFYQNNQTEIDNLADQQAKFMKLQARIEWLEEKAQKETLEITRISRDLEVDSAIDLPSLKQGDYHLIQKLANRQTNLINSLAESEATLGELNTKISDLSNTEKQQKTTYNWAITCGLLTAILAGASVFLNQPMVALIILIVGVILCLILGVGFSKKTNKSDQKLLDNQLVMLNEQIDKAHKELEEISSQKTELARKFVFPVNLPFNEWLYLWPQRAQLSQTEAELEQTRLETHHLNKEADVYRQHLNIMSEWLPVKTEPLEEVYRQLLAFVKEMRGKQSQLNKANVTNWHEPLKALQEREAKLPEKLAEIVSRDQVMTMRELPLVLANQDWTIERQHKLNNAIEQLSQVFELSQTYDSAEIKKVKEFKEQRQQEINEKLSTIQEQSQRLDFALRQQEADGTLSQLYQTRENLGEEIKLMASDWLDSRLGEQVLQDLLNFLGLQHLPRLLATASQYLKVLTLNHYKKCEFVAERLQVVSEKDVSFALGELSTGTRDQLYLAIRLAFIHLHSQEQIAPVIIDDGWLHYDSERKQALFNLLAEFSEKIQVICLSSDEELLNFAKNQAVSLEML